MAGAWRTQEFQYLSLLKNIINNGVREKGRNGITYTQIGGMMRFSLKNNQIPIEDEQEWIDVPGGEQAPQTPRRNDEGDGVDLGERVPYVQYVVGAVVCG